MKKIYLNIKFEEDKRAKGYILDIGRYGVGVACNVRINQGASLEIIPEDNILLPMRGRVVVDLSRGKRNFKYRLGIEFSLFNKEQVEKLVNFLNSIENRQKTRLSFI